MIDIKSILSRVRRTLVHRGRTYQDAEDLVHEAWLRMAGREDRDAVDNPEAFLMRTAINLSIDGYRAKRAQGDEVALDEVLVADAAPGAEAIVLGKERVARMVAGLDRIPERTRDIFLAHRLDGRSYTDIARELEISINAVEKHVSKATLLLSSWMEGW